MCTSSMFNYFFSIEKCLCVPPPTFNLYSVWADSTGAIKSMTY